MITLDTDRAWSNGVTIMDTDDDTMMSVKHSVGVLEASIKNRQVMWPDIVNELEA